VAAFNNKEDADKFYNVLGKRLGKFGLSLSMEKTKIMRFSRFEIEENGTFDFLGFEFRWIIGRKGKPWISPVTSKKKLQKSIRSFKEWCKKSKNIPLKNLTKTLTAKLRGYYNYYGVTGNFKRLGIFYHRIKIILYKCLNRRGQRKSYNWQGFNEMLKHFEIIQPAIVHNFKV
jgi:RNA-directed DNA polymerase